MNTTGTGYWSNIHGCFMLSVKNVAVGSTGVFAFGMLVGWLVRAAV